MEFLDKYKVFFWVDCDFIYFKLLRRCFLYFCKIGFNAQKSLKGKGELLGGVFLGYDQK